MQRERVRENGELAEALFFGQLLHARRPLKTSGSPPLLGSETNTVQKSHTHAHARRDARLANLAHPGFNPLALCIGSPKLQREPTSDLGLACAQSDRQHWFGSLRSSLAKLNRRAVSLTGTQQERSVDEKSLESHSSSSARLSSSSSTTHRGRLRATRCLVPSSSRQPAHQICPNFGSSRAPRSVSNP